MSTSMLRPIILPATLAGAAAPCDLFDGQGKLLLRQGHPLGQRMLAATNAPRFYCRATQVPQAARHAPLRILRDVGETLVVLENLVLTGHTPSADTLADLAAQCHEAWRFDPDACIGHARLARPLSPAIGHTVLATLFAAEIGDAHGLPHAAVGHLVGAALTMNLGSLALHDYMHRQGEAPDEATRDALRAHPQCAAALLTALPAEWQRAVAEHHENIDGSGYPRGLKRNEIALGARILRVADVLAARLLGRRGRNPHYWNLARTGTHSRLMEHIFGDDLAQLDRHLAGLLVSRLGRFPPGSMVRLSNGELAVISRRTGGNTPREALSVLTPGGHPHPRPRVRPLSAKDFHIQGYAHDEQARRLPEYDWAALWGYGKDEPGQTGQLH